ncbi:hypothetical protein HQ865_18180 [Mucilaginibacter mali]|uniref:Uncharacterized protein n=1 Tax=Mucilaginibacter mali TaxID=2740462 RepID=A0A7D4QM89_9SPHI|nr:hypothetical protein [Mucilaginibacter mali]QKJ31610.1 hypothetical protein HQ865_18180 [Mucilaginibacter mali]
MRKNLRKISIITVINGGESLSVSLKTTAVVRKRKSEQTHALHYKSACCVFNFCSKKALFCSIISSRETDMPFPNYELAISKDAPLR